MKIRKYLTEITFDVKDEIINILKRVDKEYLNAIKDTKEFIYRGGYYNNDIVIRKSRVDRKPFSSTVEFHEFLDKFFKSTFGWRARSEGVFATGNRKEAGYYGNLYLFFPLGNFEFIWSPIILDMYIDDDEIINTTNFIKKFKYTDKKLKDAILSRNEIMFKCNEYLLIAEKYKEKIMDILK